MIWTGYHAPVSWVWRCFVLKTCGHVYFDQALSKAPAPHLFKDDADLTTKVFLTHFAPECRSIARALALVVVKPG